MEIERLKKLIHDHNLWSLLQTNNKDKNNPFDASKNKNNTKLLNPVAIKRNHNLHNIIEFHEH